VYLPIEHVRGRERGGVGVLRGRKCEMEEKCGARRALCASGKEMPSTTRCASADVDMVCGRSARTKEEAREVS
jgi:hypothetical protein